MICCIFLVAAILYAGPADKPPSQFEAGNYPEAISSLTADLARSPQNSSLHYWLGRSYYELHDYDHAVEHAEEAVRLDPQNSEYNRWLGRAYGAKADRDRSFSLARKVKQAFETAVRLAPRSIEARRDLMQYCAEAPWIVGGDKQKAWQQVQAIAALDPIQGQLAHAAYLATDKQLKEAAALYLSIIGQHPQRIEAYTEAAAYFSARNDTSNLDKALQAAADVNLKDPRLLYFGAVSRILRHTDVGVAEQVLRDYIDKVPEKSDYPSHQSAREWLHRIDSKRNLENRN